MLREPTDLVILEGVEGAGKTTAARELVGRGWGYVHSSHLLRGDQVQQWFQEIGEAAAQSRAGQVVVDRMHVSTQVYGPLLRGHCSLSNFDLWAVEGWLTARGAEVRWLMPRDAAHTAEAVARRFRGMVTPRAIEVGFFRVLALTELPWRVWRESELLHERPLREPVTDEGAGSQAPRYWLLGLQHNLSPRAQRGHRWGSSFATGCGVHLYYALQVAGLGWSDLHLSNAYDDAGQLRDLRAKWRQLGEPRVAVMGVEAAKAAAEFDLPCTLIEHPQYARRFRRHDVLGYALDIQTALGVRNAA